MKWNIEALLTYFLLDQAFRIFFSIEFSIGLATAAFFFNLVYFCLLIQIELSTVLTFVWSSINKAQKIWDAADESRKYLIRLGTQLWVCFSKCLYF